MRKRAIVTDKAAKPVGPYSTAIEYGGIVYVSGITAVNPQTGCLIGNVEEQSELVLSIMQSVLEASDSSLDNVLKVTIFLNDVNDFAAVNSIYQKFFISPYPARICVQAAKIPLGALVEMDAIAYVNQENQ